MQDDPFGNLTDWGIALDTLEDLARSGNLSRCQSGLVRILRYKGNWRLREEVLKHLSELQTPSKELVHQVIAILDDDNIYYDARILAGEALVHLLNDTKNFSADDLKSKARKVIERLKSLPQPPFFDKALNDLHSELVVPTMPEN